MNYLDIFKIIPGSIVPSGRSYPENATARVALDVRKADGSVIPGCEISKGDPLTVINYDGSSLGSLDPYETATKLFEVNGLTQVVYNTDKGVNTKSGFVRYAGGSQNVVHVDIPYPNVTNAQMIQYGTSGKGRALRAYKMGNGRNSLERDRWKVVLL